MSRRVFGSLLAALIVAAPMHAWAKTARYSANVQSGVSDLVYFFAGAKPDCSFLTVDVKIVKNPRSGRVTPKIENRAMERLEAGGARHCVGRTMRAIALYYQSAPGFRGRDEFMALVTAEGQAPVTFIFTVNVR